MTYSVACTVVLIQEVGYDARDVGHCRQSPKISVESVWGCEIYKGKGKDN